VSATVKKSNVRITANMERRRYFFQRYSSELRPAALPANPRLSPVTPPL
jgi:hypothetical protein